MGQILSIPFLAVAGFFGGISAFSIAACIQSIIGNVPSGSIFAWCQSVGATSTVGTLLLSILVWFSGYFALRWLIPRLPGIWRWVVRRGRRMRRRVSIIIHTIPQTFNNTIQNITQTYHSFTSRLTRAVRTAVRISTTVWNGLRRAGAWIRRLF